MESFPEGVIHRNISPTPMTRSGIGFKIPTPPLYPLDHRGVGTVFLTSESDHIWVILRMFDDACFCYLQQESSTLV